jgi:glycosyltransferase involved in cell wall biosynthesis
LFLPRGRWRGIIMRAVRIQAGCVDRRRNRVPQGDRLVNMSNPMEEGVPLGPEPRRSDVGGLGDVIVLIPALNEAASLPLVLGDLPPVRRVIVVDNGSTDETAAVALAHGATVVHEPKRGYGAACLRGLAAVAEFVEAGEPPPLVVAFLDADYSDRPELLPQLVRPILSGHAEFVLGSRLQGEREAGAMPPQSVFGNRLACFLMRHLFRARYTDLGPFRAIQYQALQGLGMCDCSFGWTIEMQIKAAQAGLRIVEVPVPYRCRVGQSKISGTFWGSMKAGVKILYTIAKYRLLPSPRSRRGFRSRTRP